MDSQSDTKLPLILYVEDDAETFRLAAARLHTRYRLLWAQTADDAVRLLTVWGSQLYAVLVDVELKGSSMDGFMLTRLIRGTAPLERLSSAARALVPLPKLPVIVLTAYTTRFTDSDARAIGASHFCTKPIDFARLTLALAQANLQSVVNRLAGAPAFTPPSAHGPAGPRGSRPKPS